MANRNREVVVVGLVPEELLDMEVDVLGGCDKRYGFNLLYADSNGRSQEVYRSPDDCVRDINESLQTWLKKRYHYVGNTTMKDILRYGVDQNYHLRWAELMGDEYILVEIADFHDQSDGFVSTIYRYDFTYTLEEVIDMWCENVPDFPADFGWVYDPEVGHWQGDPERN